MDEILRNVLEFLNDGVVKSVLLLIGGNILKRWQPFVNKAIPTVLLLVSALLAGLKALFPGEVPGSIAPGEFMAASFMGQQLVVAASTTNAMASFVWNTAIPLALSIAAQSGLKNTSEWVRLGVGLFWPRGRIPGC